MINGKITKIKNKNGEVTFPITSSQAVMMSDGLTSVEDAINNISVSGNGDAQSTSFDNSSNGMVATNVQDAIEENKTSILSFENELSITENTSYTTANGVKEFSCKDGYVDNVVIEGKTLVNIVSMVVVNGADPDGVVRTRFSNLGDNYKFYPRTQKGTFTLMNHTDKGIWFVGMTSSDTWAVESFYVEPFSARVVTLDGSRCINGVDFQPASGWSNSDLSIYKSSMYSILEGEYDYMPYFEGLKSVGQGDSIDVLSHNKTNKNLIEDTFTYTKDMLINYSDGEFRNAIGHYACDNYIEIEPSTDYMFIGINANRAYYDENKQVVLPINNSYLQVLLDKTNGSKKNFAIEKSPSNARYIRITIHKDNLIDGKAYLYKNSNYDHKQILTTLRSLPNGVKDTIEKRGNKYYKIKRCGEVVLNENLAWFKIDSVSQPNTIQFGFKKGNDVAYKGDSEVFFNCDKIPPTEERNWQEDREFIFINPNDYIISISKTRLSTQDVAGFKTWLSQNPVTVVYELATPIIEELPNFNPQTFEGNTTLLINSGAVQAEADFEVTNSLGSELEVLKGKVSDLDNNYVRDIPIQYLNGWSGDLVCKVENKQVTIQGMLHGQDAGVKSARTFVLKLPIDSKAIQITAIGLHNAFGQYIGAVELTRDNEIKICHSDLTYNGNYIGLNLSWYLHQ